MISQHADDVIVLWITYSVNIDRQAAQRHCWLYVGGCSPYLTQIFFPQKHLPGVRLKMPKVRKISKFFFQKCSWGSETHAIFFFFFGGGGGDFGGVWGAPPGGSRGVGKRYTSSYDHDM